MGWEIERRERERERENRGFYIKSNSLKIEESEGGRKERGKVRTTSFMNFISSIDLSA
jgi:hypothetical protein